MSDQTEKLKALQTTLDKIEKTYGKGTIMKLSDERVVDIPAVPTGSLGLDIALGIGGIPKEESLRFTDQNLQEKQLYLCTVSLKHKNKVV